MTPSIYEDLRAHDEASDPSDVEERAGIALDEENLGGAFHDYELEHAAAFNAEDSRITTESTAYLLQQKGRSPRRQVSNARREPQDSNKSRWVAQSPRILEDDGDDDVPASLLIEDDDDPGPSQPNQQLSTAKKAPLKPLYVPGLPTRDIKARWETAQAHQRLYQEEDISQPQPSIPKPRLLASSPRERALWTWINATNLDHFMAQVYDYYTGAGIWCICLERFLNLLSVVYPHRAVQSFVTD
jgi:autophagy-related protein 9